MAMALKKDPWEILGVRPFSDLKEIKKAYRKRLFRCHPDISQNKSDSLEEYIELQKAYEKLKSFTGPLKPKKIWNYFSHTDKQTPRYSDGIYIFLELSAKEAFSGGIKAISITDETETCFQCQGQGYIWAKNLSCESCGGIGYRIISWGDEEIKILCRNCNGRGKKRLTCPECNGRGKILRHRDILIELPRGLRNSVVLEYGIKKDRFGIRDDIVFVEVGLALPNGWYLDGLDIHAPLEVDIWSVLTSNYVTIPTIDGTISRVISKEEFKKGKLILKNKGWQDMEGNRGDHICDLIFLLPETIPSKEVVNLLELLKILWPVKKKEILKALPFNKQ